MLISIIIPVLNEEINIRRLLRFLADFDEDLIQVIVVDGGSTDRTMEVIREFDVNLHQTKPASRAKQMNVGADEARGEILYFVHADVTLVPSFVDDIVTAVKSGVESGCYRYVFEQPRNPLLHINGFFTRFPFKWCRGGDQTLFIKKNVF